MARTSTTAPQATDRPVGHTHPWNASQLAEAVGASRKTTSRWLTDARSWHARSGTWPHWKIPEPDSLEGPATWDPARPDVTEFVNLKRQPPGVAEAYNREWLLLQYGHPKGAGGKPTHPQGRDRSIYDIAEELRAKYAPEHRPTVSWVRGRMLALDIPVPAEPARGVRSKLADVPLDVLEAAVAEHGTQRAAAVALGVSEQTLRAALTGKRVAAKAAAAPKRRARKRA